MEKSQPNDTENQIILTKKIYAIDSKLNVIKVFDNDRLTNAVHCKALKQCADYFGVYRSHVVQAMTDVYSLRAFKNYEGDFYVSFNTEIFKHLHKQRMQESEVSQRMLMCYESKINPDYLQSKKRAMFNIVQNLNVNASFYDITGCVVRYKDNIGIILINDIFTKYPTEVYFQQKHFPAIKKNYLVSFDLVAQKYGLMATNIELINGEAKK